MILAFRKLRQEDHECEGQPGLHGRTPRTTEKDPGVVTHTLIPTGETEEDNLCACLLCQAKNSRTQFKMKCLEFGTNFWVCFFQFLPSVYI